MSNVWLISYLALWVLVAFLTAAVVLLARQVAILYRRLGPAPARMENEGPEIGQVMEPAEAVALDGRGVVIGGERARHQLFVFVSATCSACDDLAPALRSLFRSERGRLDLTLASMTKDEALTRAYVGRHKLKDVPCVVDDGGLALKYNVFSPPYAVLLDGGGAVVAKGVVNILDHLESLLAAAEVGHPSVQSYVRSLHEAGEVAAAE